MHHVSIARVELGLSFEEFLDLHIHQLAGFMDRRRQEHIRTEYLFAQIVAAQINFSMAHPEHPVHPRDFMPSLVESGSGTREGASKRNRKQIVDEARSVFTALMNRNK